MKKYKLTINILLIFLFVASIIAFSLLCDITHNHWFVYNNTYREMLKIENLDEYHISRINEYFSETLCLTFSVIFSSLITAASAATFILLNLELFKNKKKKTQKDE